MADLPLHCTAFIVTIAGFLCTLPSKKVFYTKVPLLYHTAHLMADARQFCTSSVQQADKALSDHI